MTFGNWLWPLRRRQLLSAASASLKIMARAVLFERHPFERTVRDRELGPNGKPAPLQVKEQFLPGLRTLAHAVGQANKLLFAIGRGTDDDQQALRGILEPGLNMDAVDPEVRVALGREITLA